MADLNPLELGFLKSLLLGIPLPTEAQISLVEKLRSEFPDFFSQLTPDLTEEARKDNNAVIKYLQRNKGKTRQILQKQKPSFLTQQQQNEIRDALEKSIAAEEVGVQQAGQETTPPTGQEIQPAGPVTSGPPFGGMGLPAAPSISTPRIVRKIPQAQTEGQKLFVANSSGAVVGVKEVTPTSVRSVPQGPSEFHIADKSGNIVETYSKEPISASPRAETPQQPKLVTADRYGNIKEPQKPLGTQTLYTQDKSGIIKEHSIKPPSRFSTFRSKIAGAARTGLETANPFLKRMGTGGIKALSGITNLGGGQGGRRGFFGRLGGGGGRGGSLLNKAKGRGKLIAILSIIGFMILVGVLKAFAPNTTPGQTAPINNPNNSGLDYTLPIRDKTIQPLDIKSQVLAQFPKAQIDNWDIIVPASQAAGWNPAFILALWIEESGAQGKVDSQGNPLYDDPLGCAPKQKTTDIKISLKCLFDNFSGYANDQFINFMIKYAGGTPGQSLTGNDNFPKFPNVVKDWYSRLVPSGPGAIVVVNPTVPQIGIATSCPIPGGKITNYSYQYASSHPNTPGHCYGNYGYPCNCGSNGRRAKAIDVESNGQDVKLPTIEGKKVNWTYLQPACAGDTGPKGYPDCIDKPDATGALMTFSGKTDPTSPDTWYIQFVHINIPTIQVQVGSTYESDTSVGKTDYSNHVHTTIGKNIRFPLNSGFCYDEKKTDCPTDCDPGWLPSDSMCR